MRKLILLALLCAPALAQLPPTGGVQNVKVNPSGPCPPAGFIQYNTITGHLWTCGNVSNNIGTWQDAGSLSGTVNSSTAGQVAYYGANGTAVSGGAVVAPNQASWYVTQNCQGQANCTQIYGDGKLVVDGTSNSTTTVTCPDCAFTQADVGKVFWATTYTSSHLYHNTLVCPQTTIASVTNSTTAVLNAACTANATGNAVFVWGHDDGATLVSLDNKSCGAIHFATDSTAIITSEPFLSHTTSCNNPETSTAGSPRPAIVGDGLGASQVRFWITPNFDWAACAGSDGHGRTLCIGVSTRGTSNVQVWGNGLTSASNSNCANAANKVLWTTSGSASTYGLDLYGSCEGETGHSCVEQFGSDNNMDQGGAQYCGQYAGIFSAGQRMSMRGNDWTNSGITGGYGLLIDNGASVNSQSSTPMGSMLIQGNSTFASQFISYAAENSLPAIEVTSGSTLISYSDSISGSTQPGLKIDSGGSAFITNTLLTATNGGGAFLNAGTLTSGGGNKLGSLPAAGSTGSFLGSGVLVASCRGTAASGTTIWLNGLGQTTTTSCASATTAPTAGLPVQVPISGSLIQLNCTSTAGGVNASDGIVKLNRNGSFVGSLTCTFGTGTSCNSNSFDQPAQGDAYTISVGTQASSTLANITCTVLDW